MIQINRETCVRCGLCAANCCVHAIYQREDGSYACRSSLCFHCCAGTSGTWPTPRSRTPFSTAPTR